ncbi:MAG: L,D-transpeptidase family protein [Patescibacteria group bacterium]|nr:L,D-transpeptidase family protein [Patescibacteria group bacterium]
MKVKNRAEKMTLFYFLILLITVALSPSVTSAQGNVDSDGDGLSNYEEQNIYFTNWQTPDTDGDGVNDGQEIKNGDSPLWPKLKMNEADTDQDGLNDAWEIKLGSNLLKSDTDNDGYSDGQEVNAGYSPTDKSQAKISKKIEVSINDHNLKYYFGSIQLESIPISAGIPSKPTLKGTFEVQKKILLKDYIGPENSYYYPKTKWNLLFATSKNKQGYYIHGAYWHNLFGKRNVSHGCVNVRYTDMEKLYNFAEIGTEISIK